MSQQQGPFFGVHRCRILFGFATYTKMEESHWQLSGILSNRKLSVAEAVGTARSSSVDTVGHQRPAEDGEKFYNSSHNSEV